MEGLNHLLKSSFQCPSDINRSPDRQSYDVSEYTGNEQSFELKESFKRMIVTKGDDGPPFVNEWHGTIVQHGLYKEMEKVSVEKNVLYVECRGERECFLTNKDIQRCLTKNNARTCKTDEDRVERDSEIILGLCDADSAESVKIALDVLISKNR